MAKSLCRGAAVARVPGLGYKAKAKTEIAVLPKAGSAVGVVMERIKASDFKEDNMPTVHTVTSYNYQFHGETNGYQNSRSIVRLKSNGTSVAYVYFIVEGQPIPNDSEGPNWILMHMPESALPSVIDMLRNESPISIYYYAGTVRLYTGDEPIGEGEA